MNVLRIKFGYIINVKEFYTNIQSYIITLTKVFNSTIHNLKNLINRNI